ncbi:Metal chaperone YciC [Macrococcoides canis]|uniref:Metal chaperone YciC n=1 Tax=Macrococcoides canis TaxID=1855823 RepID=A0A1W7A9Y4_9STAP|nr:GTP-binding protein [Macrococcus canis]ARQ06304.1 Putative metal chaperone YciC [Macrococcus canis]
MSKKMKIIILSGFLGSGKTSLLLNLLKMNNDEHHSKIAILMNEPGGFNVDSKIIGEETPYNELLNGCICCDLKHDVAVQISDLYHRYHPDYVIIEATGVAHPVEIYDACTDPVLTRIADVYNITTIVDAKRFLERFKYTETTRRLMEEQVKYADIVIVNKMDTAEDDERIEVMHQLLQINARAEMIETSFSKIDINLLEHKGSEQHAHVHMHHGISSVVYTFKGPIDSRAFVRWLTQLPDSVLRVKGFIKFRENKEQTILFQYAYGIPQYEEESMNLPLKLVVIGEGLEKQKIMDQLDQLQFS